MKIFKNLSIFHLLAILTAAAIYPPGSSVLQAQYVENEKDFLGEIPPSTGDYRRDVERLADSPLTSIPSWAVFIVYRGIDEDGVSGNAMCSASIVSEHWLLTSAHCLLNSPKPDKTRLDKLQIFYANGLGTSRNIYFGPAKLHAHPNYQDETGNPYDIGLIQLTGVPLDLRRTGRMKFLIDGRKPWLETSEPRDFHVIGWGKGSGPGGNYECASDTHGKMRMGRWTRVHESEFKTWATWPYVCEADSGGPWAVYRGSNSEGKAFMAFGVSDDHTNSGFFWGEPRASRAIKIERHWGWLEATLQQLNHLTTYCPPRSLGGWRYRECFEHGIGADYFVGLGDRCMQIAETPPKSGSPIELSFKCLYPGGAVKQRFTPSSNGQIMAAPGLCLEVQGGSDANGTIIELAPCNGAMSQRFTIQDNGEIYSGLSNLLNQFSDKTDAICVDVRHSVAREGTPIQIYECNGTTAQRWTITGRPPVCPQFIASSPDEDFCNDPLCQCDFGQGDCDVNTQCTGGLLPICGTDNGPDFGLPNSFDVCTYPSWHVEWGWRNR